MNLFNQVCSLELAESLYNLGVKQESYFYWCLGSKFGERGLITSDERARQFNLYKNRNFDEWKKYIYEIDGTRHYSAFTVAELGEMLPRNVCWRRYAFYAGMWNFSFGDFTAQSETEADARAKMLIYLLENKLIKIEDLK